jgi:hypothetical protein
MSPDTRRTPARGGAGVRKGFVGTGPDEEHTPQGYGETAIQLSFGPTGMARRDDPPTSVAAALAVNFTAGAELVYEALVAIGKDTIAEDISDYLEWTMLPNSVSRRLLDLERLDKVIRLPTPVPGRRGRMVCAWRPR